MILIRYFDRDYTVDQLDRAESMRWHPCDNRHMQTRICEYVGYDEEKSQFYRIHGTVGHKYFTLRPRISDGKDKKKGDPYPAHWTVDPFTGESLRWYFDRDYTVEELDRGDGMRYHPVYFDDPTYMDHATYMSTGYRILLRGVPRHPIHDFYEIEAYEYCPAFRQFVLLVDGCIAQACPRISQKRDVSKGDPYPDHWNYDPFSGADL